MISFSRCTEQATNKVVVTTIEELDLDANAMSAAAAQGLMMLESDSGAIAHAQQNGQDQDGCSERNIHQGRRGDGKKQLLALQFAYVRPEDQNRVV
jgi:hypothetical protein